MDKQHRHCAGNHRICDDIVTFTVRLMPRNGGDVLTGPDYLENVMSTKHPWINRGGIGLVTLED